MNNGHTVLLVDLARESNAVLAGRLRMQGYTVVEVHDAEEGVRIALSQPPTVVVADLWMPKISGVQLCRLLGAELATRHVPVILRGPDGQRNRFWAERAGAAAYVLLGRMGDLVRALERAIGSSRGPAPLGEEASAIGDVRDRIAEYLDSALFDSVVAGEIRALGNCCEFDRLFDLLSQFVSQLTSYRWLAVATESPKRFAIHANPRHAAAAEEEARVAFGFGAEVRVLAIEDGDAYADETGPTPIVRPIGLGGQLIGHLALAVRDPEHPRDASLVEVIARELAGPIRIATLVEESQQLATVDGLTGLTNRRAFIEALDIEIARATRYGHPLSVILLDVDHFKQVNDTHGHAAGDVVLSAVGAALPKHVRKGDLVARWGGEEFVVALHSTDLGGAGVVAERMRQALEGLELVSPAHKPIPVTASFGAVTFRPGETVDALVDRADRNMYRAKSTGRNRVNSSDDAAEHSKPPVWANGKPSLISAAVEATS
ncbi:MAG: diguanylate cyclase [Myxococcales bacterium]|nr:diguanylate cyclase [Myxococcales bacterium]